MPFFSLDSLRVPEKPNEHFITQSLKVSPEIHDESRPISASLSYREVQLRARDRRRAAAHEAGHVIIARRFGCRATARIWPIRADARREHTWVGQAACDIRRASHKRRTLIGIAGAIAEEVLYPDAEFAFMDASLMRDYLEIGDLGERMSASDWRLFQGGPPVVTAKTVKRALEVWHLLSGPLRPALLIETRRLIVEAWMRERYSQAPPTEAFGNGGAS